MALPVFKQIPSIVNFSNNLNPFVIRELFYPTYKWYNFNTQLSIIKPNGEVLLYSNPSPTNIDYEMEFDPSYVIRDYISDDINFNTTRITAATNSIIQYNIVFAATSSFLGLHTEHCYTTGYLSINATKPHLEYRETYQTGTVSASQGLSLFDSVMGMTGTGKFLTNTPEKDIDEGEYETLSMLYLKPIGATHSFAYTLIKGYDFDGNLTGVDCISNTNTLVSYTQSTNTTLGWTSSFINYQNARLDVPVGLANIESISPYSAILNDSTTKYTVEIMSITSSATFSVPSIDIRFNGGGATATSFTINHVSGTSSVNSTFTFVDVPVGNTQLYYTPTPFADDWVITEILPKFNAIFNPYGYTCTVINDGASEATIHITSPSSTFSMGANTTINVTGINIVNPVATVNIIPNSNFINCADGGTFKNGIDGVTIDVIDAGLSWAPSPYEYLTVYTDDFGGTDFNIDFTANTLVPNTYYKFSVTIISGGGGALDTLTPYMNYTGATTLNTAILQPQIGTTSTAEMYFKTGSSGVGNPRLKYHVVAAGGDRIGFYINDVKLEICGTGYSISEVKTFNKKEICGRYDKQRVMFLNSYGAYDYFTFQNITNGTTQISRNTYSKPLPYNYTDRDRNDVVYNTSYQKTHSLNTGIIDRNTIYWLEDLFKSPKVFLMNGVDLIPVTLTTDSYSKYIKGRDKVVSFDVDMIEAIKNNGVR